MVAYLGIDQVHVVPGYYGQGEMALLEIPSFDPVKASSLVPDIDDLRYLWIPFPDGGS